MVEQQKCLPPGLTASQTSSPEQHCEPGRDPHLETDGEEQTEGRFLQLFKQRSEKWELFSSVKVSVCVTTWRSGVLLSWRVFRGWTSGVLPVLLAEEPEMEA